MNNDTVDAAVYLSHYGYMPSNRMERFGIAARKGLAPVGDIENALRHFQRNFGLPITGELDDATVAYMQRPRCGFPDAGSFVLTGNKWPTNSLTYRINNFTPDITEIVTKLAIADAFQLWSDKANINFRAVVSAADIEIKFGAGEHGDGIPFDGSGGVLAHAYFPGPGEISGDAHFDEGEQWSNNGNGIDLMTVAAHEFGHSLGLAHSTIPGSLMFPMYSGIMRALHADDIAGIQTLYGARVTPPAPPVPPPAPPQTRRWVRFDLTLTDNLGDHDYAAGNVDPPPGV